MKQLILFLLLSAIAHTVAAQSTPLIFDRTGASLTPTAIRVFKPVPANDSRKVVTAYDSLENFVKGNLEAYIGQDLFFPGAFERIKRYHYYQFYVHPDKAGGVYAPEPRSSDIDEGFSGRTKTIYDSIAGKYFRVINVLPYYQKYPMPGTEGRSSWLQLVERKSGDTLYYLYDKDSPPDYELIVVGFFQKQERLLKGREYVIRGLNWHYSGDTMSDIFTGKLVDFAPGSTWKCVDLVIEGGFYSPSLILENDKSEHIGLPIGHIYQPFYVFSPEFARACIRKFGNDNWNAILRLEVKPGFTEEMVEMCWGKYGVTRNEAAGTWSDYQQTVYFKEGIVTRVEDNTSR